MFKGNIWEQKLDFHSSQVNKGNCKC